MMIIIKMLCGLAGILIGGWIYLEKAHDKGWKMLIPFYNLFALADKAGGGNGIVFIIYSPLIWFIINPVLIEAKLGKEAAIPCYILAVISVFSAFIAFVILLKRIFQSMSGFFGAGWFILVIVFLVAPGLVSIFVALFGTYWRQGEWNEF